MAPQRAASIPAKATPIVDTSTGIVAASVSPPPTNVDTVSATAAVSAESPKNANVEPALHDSETTAPKAYFAPVHPALRGLVPDERSMALLGDPMKQYSRPSALRPRPRQCTAGFYQCEREMIQWRADSAIFAAIQCREGAKRAAPLSMLDRLRGIERPAIADSSCAR